jgi:AbrB family looped-hinge helix DNA binding protein
MRPNDNVIPRMTKRLIIDKRGRVTIPKLVREELRLGTGDALEMENTTDRMTLRPLHRTLGLAKEHGVWVLRTGTPLDASVTNELLDLIRRERELE